MNSLMQYTNNSLIPSPRDLVLVLPRLAQRAGSFAFYTVPEHIDGFMGKIGVGSGSVIAEKTAGEMANSTASNTTRAFLQAASSKVMGGTATATATAGQASAAAAEVLEENAWGLQTLRNFGGMFSYLLTRWALGTFLVSVILNRTQFYASSRTPLRFQWHTRLALYIIPMYMLSMQILQILQAVRCQSSPQWPELRYGDASKSIGIDYAGEGGPVYRLASSLLFWQSEVDSCSAINMAQPGGGDNITHLSGSLSLLWPLFLTLCLSQFIETLACALQGRQPMAETGMTIFEHSLAFCEAEAMLIKPWELAGKVMDPANIYSTSNHDYRLTRQFLKGFMNVPPEVLTICLISAFSHLSSNILAVLDKRKQYRLINTTVWAMCYMGAFVWAICRFHIASSTAENATRFYSVGLIGFPTVCIVGFIPHLVILGGIFMCACVYAIALLVTAIAPPETAGQPLSMSERFSIAYQNLQANVHFSAVTPIRVNWHDDFYTSLLKAGFSILTSASEAVYLNEGVPVRITSMTWLEKKRYDELVKKRGLLFKKTVEAIPQDLRFSGGVDTDASTSEVSSANGPGISTVGYAIERKSKNKQEDNPLTNESAFNDRGVGFMQRHWRWAMALRYFRGIFWLAAGFNARCVIFILEKLGIERRPAILTRLAGPRLTAKAAASIPRSTASSSKHDLQFWILQDDGSLQLPTDNNVDVEAEMRRRIDASATPGSVLMEDNKAAILDWQTYGWWKLGGWWGEVDTSGDYAIPASQKDFDTTSMFSVSTNASMTDDEWQSDAEDGRRTPTQAFPFTFSRDSTPDESECMHGTLTADQLASLIDPQTVEQQQEARMLARHLRNDVGPLTRSRYNRQVDLERARVLSSSASRQRSRLDTLHSAEAEEKELESFILERRAAVDDPSRKDSTGWNGATCVVCQHHPRTILSWPCGCLSMCDECRIGLATRNYGSCICCRSNVSAFSRIWVP